MNGSSWLWTTVRGIWRAICAPCWKLWLRLNNQWVDSRCWQPWKLRSWQALLRSQTQDVEGFSSGLRKIRAWTQQVYTMCILLAPGKSKGKRSFGLHSWALDIHTLHFTSRIECCFGILWMRNDVYMYPLESQESLRCVYHSTNLYIFYLSKGHLFAICPLLTWAGIKITGVIVPKEGLKFHERNGQNCRGLSVGQWGLSNDFATISLKDTTFHQLNPAGQRPSSGNKGCRRLPKDFVVRMQHACFAN